MVLPKTTLEQWAVLAAVVDHGSYAKAAEALHKSPTAISYALSQLQQQLEFPLLEPQGRRAVLTDHGQTLLRRARGLLREVETLERLAGSLRRGWEPTLSLVVDAAFPRTLLLKIMAELRELCPQTELQLSDAVLSGAEEAIVAGSADLVITSHVPPGHLGQFLADIPFMAVAHPDHALFQLGRPPGADDLLRHVQAVVRDSGSAHPRDDGWLGARQRCTVSSMEAALAITEAGLAFAWLPEPLVHAAIDAKRLKQLALDAGSVRRVPLYLVIVRPELAGPAARIAAECFQRHLPSSAAPQ